MYVYLRVSASRIQMFYPMYEHLGPAQQVVTSTAPTDDELPLPEVLADGIPTLPAPPAVLLHIPGCSYLLCTGFTQAWTGQ